MVRLITWSDHLKTGQKITEKVECSDFGCSVFYNGYCTGETVVYHLNSRHVRYLDSYCFSFRLINQIVRGWKKFLMKTFRKIRWIVGIWNVTIQNLETFNIRTFEIQISHGPFFKESGYNLSYSYGPNHSKTGPFKVWTFLSGFQMVFDKMAAIFLDFIWQGFRILYDTVDLL